MDHQERNHPLDHQDTKEPAVPHPAAQKGPHIAQPRARLALTSLLQKKPKPNPKLSLPARSTPPPSETSGAPHPQQGAKRLGRSCSSCSLVGAHGLRARWWGGAGGGGGAYGLEKGVRGGGGAGCAHVGWMRVHACGATRVQTHARRCVPRRGAGGGVSTRVCVFVRAPPTEARACPEAWRCVCVCIYKYKYL